MTDKVRKTEEEWRKQLTPEQYRITREAGTERAFTGEYHDTSDPGTYHCVCCGEPLFSSKTKFKSGTGWPSFHAPVDDTSIDHTRDESHGMVRTEVTCARCDAHLGHRVRGRPGADRPALLPELGVPQAPGVTWGGGRPLLECRSSGSSTLSPDGPSRPERGLS